MGAHPNRAGPAGVGEDGMLLPPMPVNGSGSRSSSSSNLFATASSANASFRPILPPVNRYSSYSANSTYSASVDSVSVPSYASVSVLEDRDSKYAVDIMNGTIKSAQSQFQTLPRIGTPLAANFAFGDLKPKADAKAHSEIDLNDSIRGSVLKGSGDNGLIVAYAYDPDEDGSDDDADGAGGGSGADWLHDPDVWPYADGDGDFHARRGDWKVRAGRWWGGTKDQSTGRLPRKEVGDEQKDDGVRLEMLGSTSTTSRASMLKAPLQSHIAPNRSPHPHSHSHSHPYLPPYTPPTTLETLLGRGAASAFSLFILIVGLLALFIVYPITQVYGAEAGVAAKILGNTAINSTGQAVI